MTSTKGAGANSTDFLLSKLDELLDEWDRIASSGEGRLVVRAKKVNRKRIAFDRAQSALLLGYCAHVMQLSRSMRLLLTEGHIVQSIPLVRLAYECALKQNWVYLTGEEAPRAISNQYGHSRKTLQKTMKDSEIPYLIDAADTLAGLDQEEFETTSKEQAKNFERMVEDFDGGNDLYTYYRMLSEYCHSSVTVADLYLTSPDHDDSNGMPVFSSTPSDFPSKLIAYFAVFSACRALYAFTTTMKEHRAKNPIRRIAKECEVTLDMKLSDKPVKRRQKAKQK
ncbi:MAG: DUF5677 domain-containing protein [Brevibacterium sp.]